MQRPKVGRFDASPLFESQKASVSRGAELYALCQTAAVNGALSEREQRALRAWLTQTKPADVPAGSYVTQLVEHILDVQRVAPADLHAIYTALESVLPAELRRHPPVARLDDRAWKMTPAQSDERLRNEVLASAHFLVAGCRQARHAVVVERHARSGSPLLLVRNGNCSHSPNAVEIRTANGKRIGWVPEQHACELAPLLEQGARYRAHLASVSRGVHTPVLIVQAYLYPSDATLGSQHTGARKLTRHQPAKVWWFVRIGVAMLITLSVAFVLRGS